MNYKALFELRIEHSYYADLHCTDFEITPTVNTEKLIRNQRLLVKPQSDGVNILAGLNVEGSLLIPLPAGTVFSFVMRIGNPDFMLYTDLGDIPAGHYPVFDNEGTSFEENSVELQRNMLPKKTPSDYFARVDISVDNGLLQPKDVPNRFVVRFEARKARWQYYFVTNFKPDAGGVFRIEDAESQATANPIVFKNLDTSDTDRVAAGLTAQYPDMTHIQFVSEQAIPCRQAVNKNIDLFIDNEKLLEKLPNPPIRNFSRLAVKTGDDIEYQDSLFQIVKHISQPFTTNGA
ncbi:MAG: hypothetical protein ACU84J_08640 [Gammaproteobacteria bacterium]